MRIAQYNIYIRVSDDDYNNKDYAWLDSIAEKLKEAFGDDLIEDEFIDTRYERDPDEGEIP